MGHFEISKQRNDQPDDEQRGLRQKPRFSPTPRPDQPSTSAGNEKRRARPTGEQSTYSKVSREDVEKTKEQKREAYRELDTLLDRPGQGTLAVSKSETRGTFEISSEYVNKLVEKAIHRLRLEEKRHIDQRREGKVEAVRGFITHYEIMQIVISAIATNSPNEWIDSEKHPAKEKELIEELQAKMQAVHRSLEGLDHLFSEKNHQTYVSREEKVASFVTKELSKLEEMKQAMEEISQKEGGKKLGSRGKRALETMKKCYEYAEQMSDYSHTLGALEQSLNDIARNLYALTEIIARKALDKANKLISEVKNWDDEPTIKDIVTHRGYAQDARQCFERLQNLREKCLALTTQQHDKKAREQLLTALKDLIGHYDEALFVKQVIELAKDLTGRHDGILLGKRVIELVKDLTGHPDKGIMKQVIEGLGKAMKLSLEVQNHGWDELTLANLVEDYRYAGYARKCIDNLNTQLEEYFDLFKGQKTPIAVSQDHYSKELLTALRDLTDLRKEVKTVKRVRELVQARKQFAQTRDLEAARRLRKALKKFKPSQLLLEDYRKRLTDRWIRISIEKVDDKLICQAIDKVINSKKINKKSTLENTDEQSNMINYANDSVNNLAVFEEDGTKLYFWQLREKWSEKEWFSKFQMLDERQIREVMKEYYESYMKAVDQKVQDVVQEGDPQMWICCQPETLIQILQCGRFKSLFETCTTGGNKDMDYRNRANTEHAYAGMPHKMPRPFRLIFGYATISPGGEGSRSLERFGPVAVRLKSELKEFALQVLGDFGLSEAIFCRSTFFDAADRHCLPLDAYIGSRILKIQGREELEKAISWHEFQIPAVYAEDIQEVVFHKHIDDARWLKKNITKQLEQHAITYRNSPFFQKEDIFQAAIRPYYQKVLDISGKEIFTEDEYCQYQQYKEEIVTAMGKENDVLIGSLQKIPFFEDLYGMESGTLQKHTSMVLEQFRKYQMENWNSPFLIKEDFQLILAIHDIEITRATHEIKSILDHRKKIKEEIHEKYKGRIIPGLLEWLGIPEEKSKLMVALTLQDHLRSFLQYSNSELTEWEREKTKRIAKEISDEAAKIGIGVKEYFDLIICYYRAEAGSYTTDARCHYGFKNFLFEQRLLPIRPGHFLSKHRSIMIS